ncbi:MAG: phytoene dehydrogenase-like protein [Desulforhopalus sp.]|jgi:phytoene dehydrogenase-like protein
MQHDVVVIGGGVAGLTCAIELHKKGRQVLILEAMSYVGGRIATETVDGFLLDRGFQVLQTGYPDISSYLDLEGLHLKDFPSGVVIRYGGGFHQIADPRKNPGSLLSTLVAPIGSIGDRFRMLRLVRSVTQKSMPEIFEEKEETALDFLKRSGFTDTFINSFFIPFFAGATLERSLNASSYVLQYLVRVFAMGKACLPAAGMEDIPKQLVARLPSQTVRYNARVDRIDGTTITLSDGEDLQAKHIVLATDEPSFKHLMPESGVRRSVAETCIYFSADWTPPFKNPFLILNGETDGPINNIAFPSMVSSQYAPPGKTLIAIVVLGEEWQKKSNLLDLVQSQCLEWFGESVKEWSHLKTYRLAHALPDQSLPMPNPYRLPDSEEDNIFTCGEHQGVPGLLWAMMSGRLAAEKIIG